MIRSFAFSLMLLPSVAAAQPGAALPQAFDFAKAELDGFELKARTEVNWNDGQPYVDEILCEGASEDVLFEIEGDGNFRSLRLSFHGLPDEDGERADITYLGDTLWLYVDGRRYEYRNIGMPAPTFSNHIYPPDPNADREIILVWRGHQAVRALESDPFMHLSRLYSDLVGAKRIEWGYKSRNWRDVDRREPENQLPDGWETRRYPIKVAGLRGAVDWCTRQVASDAAKRLPADLAGEAS